MPDTLTPLVTALDAAQADVATKQAALDAAKATALTSATALQEAVNTVVAELMPSNSVPAA